MLNLNDLKSGHGSNFFDVSGVPLKPMPRDGNSDGDDEEEDNDEPIRHFRMHKDSLCSETVASPWEFDDYSSMASQPQKLPPELMSSFAFSEGGGILVGRERPFHATPDTSFAIRGDDGVLSSIDSSTSYHPVDASPLRQRLFYVVVASLIVFCLIFHAGGLLVFFTPWYNRSIQVSLFRAYYTSFSSPGFQDNVGAKRDAVAFVYLLSVGTIPTLLASSLWFMFSSDRPLRQLLHVPAALRRKPVVFTAWEPLYFAVTHGEIAFLVLLVVSNTFIFIEVLLRARTSASPNDKIWRDVSRAFAFTAIFNSVWLLLVVPKPSPWTVYLSFFGICDPGVSSKYRKWLGGGVVLASILHAVCMGIHLYLAGQFSAQLLSGWSELSRDPMAGRNVFGVFALAAMISVSVVRLLSRHVPHFVVAMTTSLCASLGLLALFVHYPLAMAWFLPPLALLLIQRAAVWAHTRSPVELLDMAPLPNGITRLVLRRTINDPTNHSDDFIAGQRVYINIPSVSWLKWRCCTLASSPSRQPGIVTVYVDAALDLDTRTARSAWAGGVHDVAKVAYAAKKPPVVHVDGYYGPSHPIFYEKYRCLVLIAGETGIFRVLSILEQLYHSAWLAASARLDRKVNRELLGDMDAIDGIAAEERVGAEGRTVWLLWTCRDVCLFKEFEDLFFRIKTLDPHENYFRLRFFLTAMPTHDDLKYQRLPSAGFGSGNISQTEVKGATGQLPAQLRQGRLCCRPESPRPQNRSAICCWRSRPLHRAMRSRLTKILALWIICGVAVTLSIVVEWWALRSEVKGVFQPVRLAGNALLVLSASLVGACLLAFLGELFERRSKREDQWQHPPANLVQRTDGATPRRGLKKLRSMTKMAGEPDEENQQQLECGTFFRDTAVDPTEVGPDVIERLVILSLRPDIDKFLRTVGRSFPRFAGTVGVFASGNKALVDQVEASTLACEAGSGEWKTVKAAFDFHGLT